MIILVLAKKLLRPTGINWWILIRKECNLLQEKQGFYLRKLIRLRLRIKPKSWTLRRTGLSLQLAIKGCMESTNCRRNRQNAPWTFPSTIQHLTGFPESHSEAAWASIRWSMQFSWRIQTNCNARLKWRRVSMNSPFWLRMWLICLRNPLLSHWNQKQKTSRVMKAKKHSSTLSTSMKSLLTLWQFKALLLTAT